MADFQGITSLFSSDNDLPKYSHKRWVKTHPSEAFDNNGGGLTGAIQYNCKNLSDKLVDYASGYILLNVTVNRAALIAKEATPKGAHAFVNQAIIRINDREVDNSQYNYVTVPILNSLEYSNDFARVAEQYLFSKDMSDNTANNAGHTVRQSLIPDPANNAITFSVKLPLAYVSTFFRTLDFPIINQRFEMDITYRLTNAILRENGAITVVINSAPLYLPVVELPREQKQQMLKKLSSSMKKTLVWHKLKPRDSRNNNGAVDIEIAPSIDGVRKLYCVAVPVARWDNQTHIESTSDTAITNINLVVDGEDFYPQNIENDEDAYEMISENFNMGGKDVNTGAMLNFADFRNVHRYYAFDLSRQKVFESDPRKSQSIRFRGQLAANSRLLFFLAQEKQTTFDFTNPENSTTV